MQALLEFLLPASIFLCKLLTLKGLSGALLVLPSLVVLLSLNGLHLLTIAALLIAALLFQGVYFVGFLPSFIGLAPRQIF